MESVHTGHAVVCDAGGSIVAAWGSPEVTVYPRSSCKMVQALPLVESGAAEAFGLNEAELAALIASVRPALTLLLRTSNRQRSSPSTVEGS